MSRPKAKRKNKHLIESLKTRSDNISGVNRDLTCRTYTYIPDSINEKDRTVEAVIATNAPVMVFDMKRYEPILEVLDMTNIRLPEKVPFLDSHQRDSTETVMGSTYNFRISDNKLLATNKFSSVPRAQELWTKVKEGHITDNSIGYRVYKYQDIEPGESANVNGRNYKAPDDMPLRISTDWEFKENSAVSIGADIMAKNRNEINRSITMDFNEWLRNRGMKIDSLTEAEIKAIKKVYEAEEKMRKDTVADGGKKQDDIKNRDAIDASKAQNKDNGDDKHDNSRQLPPTVTVEQAIANERKRVSDIQQIGDNEFPELTSRAISEGWSTDKFREELLPKVRESRKTMTAPGIIVNDNTIDKRLLEAVMLLRSGYNGDVLYKDRSYGEKVTDIADSRRDMNLLDLCRHAIMLDGKSVPQGTEETITRAFSTYTLPGLMSNVANKQLLAAYMAAPETWRAWCSIGVLNDFKAHRRLRASTAGGFKLVGNGGEVPHGTYREEYEDITGHTYAKQFRVTRQDIINNDVNAFTTVPADLGREAAGDLSDLVYTILLANGAMGYDSTAIFASGHGNLQTSSALASSTLDSAYVLFKAQTGLNGKPISMNPSVLLVPPALMGTATRLYVSERVVATGVGSSAALSEDANIWRNRFQPIDEPRLSNSSFTGYSATSWYLMATPASGAKNIEVGFLNGVQNPVIRQFEPGVDYVGGINFQAYFDAGVAAIDYRGMVKSTA